MPDENIPKLDRTAFHAGGFESSAAARRREMHAMTPEERLRASYYLNSVAYGYDPDHPPKVDRTVFSMRKHSR